MSNIRSVSKLDANITANIGGAGVAALTQLACAPIFVKLLGIDGYGLIGFFLTLQGSLRILDLGLTPTMSRQLARYSVQVEKSQECRNFVRTLEIVYWLIGIVMGVGICFAAPVIADRWIKPGLLPVGEVRDAVVLMGVLIAVQWPLSLYQGGLLGLQRQVQMNAIRSVAALTAGFGAVAALWLVSANILTFFVWQVLAGFGYVLALGLALWRDLPPASRRARFDIGPLREIASFTGGMSGTSIAGATLTQMDKIVLSKLLPMDLFGYYTLGALVASSLQQLFIGPLFNAVFPKLSALVAEGNERGERLVYHKSSQLMSVLIFPLALVLAFFAPEVLRLWTGSAAIAANVTPIVQLLVAGNAIMGVMWLPYALQLANGWTSLGLAVSAAMCVVMLPAVYLLAAHFGGIGAATAWLIVGVLNLAIAFPLTHRRLLKGEALRWLRTDIGVPLLVAAVVVMLGRQFLTVASGRIAGFAELGLLLAVAYAAAAVSAPAIRTWGRSQLRLLAGSTR